MEALKADKPSSKGQAWFCTTGLPSDIVVEVGDMSFHLHKFPLMSKSRRLHELIIEQETSLCSALPARVHTSDLPQDSSVSREEREEAAEEDDEIVEDHCQITLTDFPGGSEIFELAAKFCYGVKVDLSPSNVAALRCAGEFLGMTEEYSEENLVSKTERFLSHTVLKSINFSIKALKSCDKLTPLADTLGIVQRCIDSIVTAAPSADPALFGWPVSDAGANEAASRLSASKEILWNGIETMGRKKGAARGVGGNGESWFEDLAALSLPLFKQLILAMKERDLIPEIVESCVMYYAKKYIPGVSRSNRKPAAASSSSSSTVPESEQRELLETIISNLPLEKSSRSSTSTRFLFGLLRTTNILNASETCRAALEKKIGLQLEEATLDDLLIPSYSYLNETLYDVDCVERILGYFLDGLDQHRISSENDTDVRPPALMLVGKLIDGYLSEIASDANLKPEKLCDFALSLPEQARLFDDGLYRAVDVYLKAHPWISEAEREKICGVMDCQKLTLEACTHAAQNERLPLRAVVQVLFFEQLQLRQAIAGTLMAAVPPAVEGGRVSGVEEGEGELELGEDQSQSQTWRAAVRENQVLRLDMDTMRTRVHQLERECSTMKKVIEKMDKGGDGSPQGGGRGWKGSLSRKFGCKFKTQVCDSHEPSTTVSDTRKTRRHNRQHQD